MMDEIWELRETVNNMGRQIQTVQTQAVKDQAVRHVPPKADVEMSSDEEREILAAIDHLAARIDSVAARLAKI